MKYSSLVVLVVLILVGCGAKEDSAVIPNGEVISKDGYEIETPLKQSDSMLSDTNSNWDTYTDEKYGFTVDYVKGWTVVQQRASSIRGEGPGISCEDALVEDCPFDSFYFSQDAYQVGDISAFSITRIEKDHPLLPSQSIVSEWVDGIALGCQHTKLVSDTDYGYVLYAFLSSSGEDVVTSKKMCDSSELSEITERMFQSFAIL